MEGNEYSPTAATGSSTTTPNIQTQAAQRSQQTNKPTSPNPETRDVKQLQQGCLALGSIEYTHQEVHRYLTRQPISLSSKIVQDSEESQLVNALSPTNDIDDLELSPCLSRSFRGSQAGRCRYYGQELQLQLFGVRRPSLNSVSSEQPNSLDLDSSVYYFGEYDPEQYEFGEYYSTGGYSPRSYDTSNSIEFGEQSARINSTSVGRHQHSSSMHLELERLRVRLNGGASGQSSLSIILFFGSILTAGLQYLNPGIIQ